MTSSVGRLCAVVIALLFGLAAACSGADENGAADDEAASRTTVTGHAGTVPAAAVEPVLESLMELWMEAGATESLARCYAELLRDEGLIPVADLEELAAVQGDFTAEQAEAFAACGTNA